LRQIRQQGAPQDAVLTLIDNLCWPSLSDDLKWALLDINNNNPAQAKGALFDALSKKNIGDQIPLINRQMIDRVEEIMAQPQMLQKVLDIRNQGFIQTNINSIVDTFWGGLDPDFRTALTDISANNLDNAKKTLFYNLYAAAVTTSSPIHSENVIKNNVSSTSSPSVREQIVRTRQQSASSPTNSNDRSLTTEEALSVVQNMVFWGGSSFEKLAQFEKAALAIGKLKDRRAIIPLIKILSDHNPKINRRAAVALAYFDDDVLTEVLSGFEESEIVKDILSHALFYYESESGLMIGEQEKTCPIVERVLSNMRGHAIMSIIQSRLKLHREQFAKEPPEREHYEIVGYEPTQWGDRQVDWPIYSDTPTIMPNPEHERFAMRVATLERILARIQQNTSSPSSSENRGQTLDVSQQKSTSSPLFSDFFEFLKTGKTKAEREEEGAARRALQRMQEERARKITQLEQRSGQKIERQDILSHLNFLLTIESDIILKATIINWDIIVNNFTENWAIERITGFEPGIVAADATDGHNCIVGSVSVDKTNRINLGRKNLQEAGLSDHSESYIDDETGAGDWSYSLRYEYRLESILNKEYLREFISSLTPENAMQKIKELKKQQTASSPSVREQIKQKLATNFTIDKKVLLMKTPEDFDDLVQGKNVMLIETHPDDIMVNIGASVQAIVDKAKKTYFVSVIPDPAGITDEFVSAFLNEQGWPEGVQSGDREGVKVWIRKQEALTAASLVGIRPENYINLGILLPPTKPVYREGGRINAFESVFSTPSVDDLWKVQDLIKKHLDIDIYLLQIPFGNHQHHRDIASLFLRVIVRQQEGVQIIFYEDFSEFTQFGIEANMVYFYTEEIQSRKAGIIDEAYLSQNARHKDSPYGQFSGKLSLAKASEEYRRFASNVTLTEYPYAERFIRGYLPAREGRSSSSAIDLIDRMRNNVETELQNMQEVLIAQMDIIKTLAFKMILILEEDIKNGIVYPQSYIRLSQEDPQEEPAERALKVGFFPLMADPIHWGHLLITLSAAVEYKLDKVVYIVGATDMRKPDSTPAQIRHYIAKVALKILEPLLEYTPIALGTDFDGETSIFRILDLNPKQRIDAYYIAGGDHAYFYGEQEIESSSISGRKKSKLRAPNTMLIDSPDYQNWVNRFGVPPLDTIGKLNINAKKRIYEYNPQMHSISLLIIEREEAIPIQDLKAISGIPIDIISGVPFRASSTEARYGKIQIVPWSVYNESKNHNLYGFNLDASSPSVNFPALAEAINLPELNVGQVIINRNNLMPADVKLPASLPVPFNPQDADKVKRALAYALKLRLKDNRNSFDRFFASHDNTVTLNLRVTGHKAPLATSNGNTIVMHWRMLRAPPQLQTIIYTKRLAVSLRIVLYHALRQLIDSDELEGTRQQYAIEKLQQNPVLLNTHLTIINPSLPNGIAAKPRWFYILNQISQEKMQEFYAVLPADAELFVAVQEGLSGRFKHVFDPGLGKGIAYLDGVPQKKPIELMPVDSALSQLKSLIGTRNYIVVPHSNFFFNDLAVMYKDGIIYHADGEFNKDGLRMLEGVEWSYPCFVVKKDNSKDVMRLYFRKGTDGKRDSIVNPTIGKDVSDKIKIAFFAQQLIEKGEVVDTATIAHEFADPGHLSKPYTHNLLGITDDERLIIATFAGDRLLGQGLLPQEAAIRVQQFFKRRNIDVDKLVLLSNGGDATVRINDDLATLSFAGRIGTGESRIRTAATTTLVFASYEAAEIYSTSSPIFREVSDGIEVADIVFDEEGRFARGHVARIDPSKVDLKIWIDKRGVNYDFSRFGQTKRLAKQLRREYKSFPGETVRGFRRKYKPLFAVNGHQGNFWLPNTLIIADGRLIVKTVPGIRQTQHVPLTGKYYFFVLDRNNVGIREINLVNDLPQEDISSINYAIGGPLLRCNNQDKISSIRQVMPPLGTNEVTWNLQEDSFAFSLIGKDAKGLIIQASMKGNPNKQPETKLAYAGKVAADFELSEAILLGSAKDVQQYVGGKLLEARARRGSTTSKAKRKLASIIYAEDASSPSRIDVVGRDSLEEAYRTVWQVTTDMVGAGKVPQPIVINDKIYFHCCFVALKHFPQVLRRRISQIQGELADEFEELHVMPLDLMHTTVFIRLFDIPIETVTPDDYLTDEVSDQFRRDLIAGLNGRQLIYTFRGINLGPDGAGFYEGHVDDNTVFDLRDYLGRQYPDPKRKKSFLHMSSLRVVKPISVDRFRKLYSLIEGYRDKEFGRVVVSKLVLAEGFDNFGLNRGKQIEIDLNTASSPMGEQEGRSSPLSRYLKLPSCENVTISQDFVAEADDIKNTMLDTGVAPEQIMALNDGKYRQETLISVTARDEKGLLLGYAVGLSEAEKHWGNLMDEEALPNQKETFYILSVAVRRGFQGLGIGSALISHVLSLAKATGYHWASAYLEFGYGRGFPGEKSMESLLINRFGAQITKVITEKASGFDMSATVFNVPEDQADIEVRIDLGQGDALERDIGKGFNPVFDIDFDTVLSAVDMRINNARKVGKLVVTFIAMEMPLTDKKGKRLTVVGGATGGQSIYIEDVPYQLWKEKGIASFVIVPLFSANVKEDYGTLDNFLVAYDGRVLTEVLVPVGLGTIPLKVIYVEQQGGLPVFLAYDEKEHFFTELYHREHTDSSVGYIEAILLPRLALMIQDIIRKKLSHQFDVLHFNDWQTALGPMFFKEQYKDMQWPLERRPVTVFTTHNLEYQGLFPGEMAVSVGDPHIQYLFECGVLNWHRWWEDSENNAYLRGDNEVVVELFKLTNLPWWIGEGRNNEGIEFWSQGWGGFIPGRHNLMKGAFIYADKIVFVSQGHLKEVLTIERGYGLDGVLKTEVAKDPNKLTAVYNGIRAENHRPPLPALQKDGFIAEIGSDLLAWIEQNKKALQEKLGLDSSNPYNLLIGIVTRIVKQKGLNILFTPIEEDSSWLIKALLDIRDDQTGAKILLPILGTAKDPIGEVTAELLRQFAKRKEYSNQFRFIEKFDRDLAKQIGAGALVGLMPSIDEPGGLANQELALLLSILIVTDRGGLNDFYQMQGTPIAPVPGFDIDGPELKRLTNLAEAKPDNFSTLINSSDPRIRQFSLERMRTARGIYDSVLHIFDLYLKQPRKIKEYLGQVAAFNPDWGVRIDAYETVYRDAIDRVIAVSSPGQRILLTSQPIHAPPSDIDSISTSVSLPISTTRFITGQRILLGIPEDKKSSSPLTYKTKKSTRDIYNMLEQDATRMARKLGRKLYNTPSLTRRLEIAETSLTKIAENLDQGIITPQRPSRLPILEASDSLEKYAYFPTAGFPVQLDHLLIGLVIMAQLGTDNVIYAIAGDDYRKPWLHFSIGHRHPLAESQTQLFKPFYLFTPNNSRDGETDMFRHARRQKGRRVRWIYVVGGDHYHRWARIRGLPNSQQPSDFMIRGTDEYLQWVIDHGDDPAKDTIQKLEDNIRDFGLDPLHTAEVGFIARGGDVIGGIPTTLKIHEIPEVGDASATAVRDALKAKYVDQKPWDHDDVFNLSMMPYSGFEYISAAYKRDGTVKNIERLIFLDMLIWSQEYYKKAKDAEKRIEHVRRSESIQPYREDKKASSPINDLNRQYDPVIMAARMNDFAGRAYLKELLAARKTILIRQIIEIINLFLRIGTNPNKQLILPNSVKDIFARYGIVIPSEVSLGDFADLTKGFKKGKVAKKPRRSKRSKQQEDVELVNLGISSKALRRVVKVSNPLGIHMQNAVEVAKIARSFGNTVVRIKKGKKLADCKKVMELMALAIEDGQKIEIIADGNKAKKALDALAGLIETSSSPSYTEYSPPSDEEVRVAFLGTSSASILKLEKLYTANRQQGPPKTIISSSPISSTRLIITGLSILFGIPALTVGIGLLKAATTPKTIAVTPGSVFRAWMIQPSVVTVIAVAVIVGIMVLTHPGR